MSKEIIFKSVGGEMRFNRYSFFKRAYPQMNVDSAAESKNDVAGGKHNKVCSMCNQKISEYNNNLIDRKIYAYDMEQNDFSAKLKPKISSYEKMTQDKIMSLF